ncbi:class I SAM-dependent methyltransferase [Chitinolyticbacter albus]|uniref:class I SAM-dependent methyltransferase n=1 Tax=Chitinolyticbacter albus TaxID=2961951 RepID=UPI00210C14DC|nr:class I SAM-dependent methyltransferase [Chitinolyticbacter albus]
MQAIRLFGVQLAAVAAVVALARALAWPLTTWQLATASGVVAALLAYRVHDGRWWSLIHFCFPWAVLAATQLALPAWAWALAFAVTLLVYGAVWRTRVPLYLSNGQALARLSEHVPPGASLVDLGAGTGTVLAWFARHRPDVRGVGVEAAWLPWLVGRIRLAGLPVAWQRGDLYAHPLAGYDVVYAYLSPAAMPALWRKIEAELGEGALFVSNCFDVPDQPPRARIAVGDWKGSELLLWQR